MRDVPQRIIDILDTVGFQTFDVGGMISGGITWMWSGVIWGIRKVPKLIWRRYAYGTAIAVYSVNHHVLRGTPYSSVIRRVGTSGSRRACLIASWSCFSVYLGIFVKGGIGDVA